MQAFCKIAFKLLWLLMQRIIAQLDAIRYPECSQQQKIVPCVCMCVCACICLLVYAYIYIEMATSLPTHCGSAKKSITILTERAPAAVAAAAPAAPPSPAATNRQAAPPRARPTDHWVHTVNQLVIDFVWQVGRCYSYRFGF